VAVIICFGVLSLVVISVYQYLHNLGNFINFTMSTLCNTSCTVLCVLNLQLSSSFMGRYIFLAVLAFEHSKSIYFLWCHYPGIRSIA
jgi:hypothetical protein